jgi:hypothetical protein
MNCPHCGKEINVGTLLGSVSTPAKTRAARENAKLGGWPKGRKRKKPRKARTQNTPAHRPDQ